MARSRLGVAHVGGGSLGRHRIDAPQVLGGGVLLEGIAVGCAGDGDNLLAPGRAPRPARVPKASPLFPLDLTDAVDEGKVFLEIFPWNRGELRR